MAKRKRARARAAERQDNTLRYAVIGGVAALGIIALFVLLYLNASPPEPIEGLITYPAPPGAQHDASFVYPPDDLPPYGGVHHPQWQNCGVYEEPIQAVNAVHSLEHGAVWITYQSDLSQEGIGYLQEFARGESHVLVSPYPSQASPVVLTAWGLQLEVDELPDDRIAQFIRRYQQGPQTPERGALCSQGVGEPVG